MIRTGGIVKYVVRHKRIEDHESPTTVGEISIMVLPIACTYEHGTMRYHVSTFAIKGDDEETRVPEIQHE